MHRIRQRLNHCVWIPQKQWRDAWQNERHWVDASYMGGDLNEEEDETPESNADGCPGAWYRTPFFFSLQRYLRPCADGIYSANQNLDRTSDRLVIDAVQVYETEQARARGWANQKIDDHFRSQS